MDAEAEVERPEKIDNNEQVVADHQKHAKVCADLASAHETVCVLHDRWAELEAMQE